MSAIFCKVWFCDVDKILREEILQIPPLMRLKRRNMRSKVVWNHFLKWFHGNRSQKKNVTWKTRTTGSKEVGFRKTHSCAPSRTLHVAHGRLRVQLDLTVGQDIPCCARWSCCDSKRSCEVKVFWNGLPRVLKSARQHTCLQRGNTNEGSGQNTCLPSGVLRRDAFRSTCPFFFFFPLLGLHYVSNLNLTRILDVFIYLAWRCAHETWRRRHLWPK